MNYGLYLSASGVLTNLYRQDVFANNLANVRTPAFKPDVPAVRQRAAEAIEDPAGMGVAQALLDRLGGGALAGPQHMDFRMGPTTRTGKPFDAALDDSKSFFQIRYIDPITKKAGVRLSRDGRFTRNDVGQLVNQDGLKVLDVDGEAIEIPGNTTAHIEASGRVVTEDGTILGQIGVVRVADTDKLIKQGGGLYQLAAGASAKPVEQPLMHPGFVEGSGVNPIRTLMKLTASTRAVTNNVQMIKYFDRLMNQAVNTLGMVA